MGGEICSKTIQGKYILREKHLLLTGTQWVYHKRSKKQLPQKS